MAATAPAPAGQRAPARSTRKRTVGLWMATAPMIGSGVSLLPASPAGAAGPIVGTRSGQRRHAVEVPS
jgi:hypothetical protein